MADNLPVSTDTNEITVTGKFFAGLQLIAVTAAVIYFIIGYWPNKMPPLGQGDDAAWYHNKLFHIDLLSSADSGADNSKDSLSNIAAALQKNISRLKDSSTTTDPAINRLNDSLVIVNRLIVSAKQLPSANNDKGRIHLNTILLILVALTGFLGNMIHIASSFTNFIGSGTFKRSWVLWYYVKPITAAALAIIVYFIVRAGFLSYGTGASGISLYGILSLAAFAGLFTDSATLKLQEIFEVIFKPKDNRQDKMADPVITITSLSPQTIPKAVESTITIKGSNLDQVTKVAVDGNAIKPSTMLKDTIEIQYTPTTAAPKAIVTLSDKNGKEAVSKEIMVS